MTITSDGRGTTISIILPVHRTSELQAAEFSGTVSTDGLEWATECRSNTRSMRILLADDNERIRRGVRAILSSQPDFEVCGEATDGGETIRIARELVPDLILLDVSMPEMDGLHATRLLRAAMPSVRIVIMSQHDPARLLPSALAAGANACVDKGSLASDLIAVISSVDRRLDDNRAARGD